MADHFFPNGFDKLLISRRTHSGRIWRGYTIKKNKKRSAKYLANPCPVHKNPPNSNPGFAFRSVDPGFKDEGCDGSPRCLFPTGWLLNTGATPHSTCFFATFCKRTIWVCSLVRKGGAGTPKQSADCIFPILNFHL